MQRQLPLKSEECVNRRRKIMGTDPPLKAPTGFFTGKGVTSANLRVDVWKLRVARTATEGVERVRIAGERMREAIV